MHTFDLHTETPARSHEAREARPATPVKGENLSRVAPSIQRKAGCACGGGCSRCQAAASASKYTVNTPGDRYEQEADRVAEQVMRMPDPQAASMLASTASRHAPESGSIQRACASCGGGTLEKEREIQAKEEYGATPHLHGDVEGRIDALRGGGSPLPSSVREYFEPRFGADFSGVRVHTDGHAAETARAVRAQAYTIGRDIVFGAGHYAPHTESGQRLLAHELTHTIQQGASAPTKGSTSGVQGRSAGIQRRVAQEIQRISDRRIQRVTDASFESGTGVGPAITAGTMTTDPAVHNQTFTATNCFGRSGCNVRFQFAKGYKGDYNYVGGSGRRVRGVYTKISITYDAACGSCNRVQVLQAMRNITQSGGNMVAADPTDPVRRTRSGWGDASAPSRGWRVDTLTNVTNSPFTSSIWSGQAGTSTTPALSYDSPGDWSTTTNAGKEFQTCAICTPSTGSSTVLGCVSWGYYIDGSGTVAFRPATPSATCGTVQTVTDATNRWNAIPGNTSAGIDFTHNPTP